MARRGADVWDDLFEALRCVFAVVHPAWSILVAVVFFFIPVIWFQHSIKIPEAQMLGYMLDAIPALVSLAAGVAGWKLRQQRAVFLLQHLDIGWLNKEGLSPQFLDALDEVLKHRELVKVKFDEFKEQKKELAPQLAEKSSSHLVTRVGNVVVLYRPKPVEEKKPQSGLPTWISVLRIRFLRGGAIAGGKGA
jgi:RNA-binding protein